jgi:hypothetical protein
VAKVSLVRRGRVFIDQREVSVRIRFADPLEFSQNDGLNDGEPLIRPLLQIVFSVFTICPVEYLLSRIAKPVEGRTVRLDQKPSILTDSQLVRILRRRG